MCSKIPTRKRSTLALRQWSEEFSSEPGFATLLVDREKGRPVRKLELRSQDGRLLNAADTMLKPGPGLRRPGLRRRQRA
jgi:hypothetical protein